MELTGNIVALVTPFRNGAVEQPALARLIEHVLAGGASGLVPCGTTGESPTLSHEEHDRVVAWTVEAARGRVPVIAGTGSNCTEEAIRLTVAAARHGASAVLSVNPYYNRPTQEGLYRHFAAIAEASPVPVVLYNIPGRTSVELSLETIVRLAEHPNVQAIKEATGNVENVTRLRGATRLTVLSGDDSLTLPMLALGARGVISVLGNLLPARITELVRLAQRSDLAGALALHDRLFPLMKALFLESNPGPVKAALALAGLAPEELRLPLVPVAAATRKSIAAALEPFLAEVR